VASLLWRVEICRERRDGADDVAHSVYFDNPLGWHPTVRTVRGYRAALADKMTASISESVI
jgi:hypothetical protein